MKWRNRAAWLYQNSTPDYPKLVRYGIKTIYVDPRSSNAKAVIQEAAGGGYAAGFYIVANWYPGATGKRVAEIASGYIDRLIPQAYPLESQWQGAPVMFDLEAVSKEWTAECIVRFRQLRPSRETAYTNEPFKDGTVVPIPTLIEKGLHWYPQLYYGDMTPADPAAVLLEVGRWGFPADRLHPFYDGARVPGDWRDGCVFTQERLP